MQAKRWRAKVGNSAVMEVHSGMAYGAETAYVVASSWFTPKAEASASRFRQSILWTGPNWRRCFGRFFRGRYRSLIGQVPPARGTLVARDQ